MINFSLILPEITLFCGALIILMADSFFGKKVKEFFYLSHLISLATCAVAIFLTVSNIATNELAFNDMFNSNSFTAFTKAAAILFLTMVILLSLNFISTVYKISAEFLALLMIATVGGMVMISANDFLVFYLGLELQALSLYLLAALNRASPKSSEAGMKYFILGCLASGLLLFGISMIYGFSGTTNFKALNALYKTENVEAFKNIPLAVMFGFVMVLTAMFFKISAAPFHMWTPDVYEGSAPISTTFFATIAKFTTVIALLNLFARVILGWPGIEKIFIFVSLASLAVGSFGAIFQKNLKRLLAYSSIGHIGFILLAMAAFSKESFIACTLYMMIYAVISIGSFGFLTLIKTKNTDEENDKIFSISSLAGLGKSHPTLAFALAVLMFSTAGIPPFAGFFSKFYVLTAAIGRGLLFYAIAAIIFSVVSAFYYLRIIKVMYFDEPQKNHPIEFENYNNAKLIILLTAAFNLFFIFFLDAIITSITNFIAF
jgi:NADH-quinone oxidoreductase subunit N